MGTAYEVHALSELRPTAGLEIEAAITELMPNRRVRLSEVRIRSGAEGRFTLALPMPTANLASPELEIMVRRTGRPARTFRFRVAQLPSRAFELLTDRNRYQPGETIGFFRSFAPRAVAGAPLTFVLSDAQGTPIAERTSETGESGAASAEIPIPESAAIGEWMVRVRSPQPGANEAARTITIGRRTVERLAVDVSLERDFDGAGRSASRASCREDALRHAGQRSAGSRLAR